MSQGTPETVVYVSNAGVPSISILAMNRATGDVDLIEKTAIPGAEEPSPTSMPLALSPDRRFLYAALAERVGNQAPMYARAPAVLQRDPRA
jgi:6-phosphogluconolactonase